MGTTEVIAFTGVLALQLVRRWITLPLGEETVPVGSTQVSSAV